jgi:hypothetical protein
VVITGNGNVVYLGPDRGEYFKAGLRHIDLRMYTRALEDFSLAMSYDAGNPDVYYLSAVASLNGQKAFLAPLERIRQVEELTHAAIALEERGVFHYLLAYVGLDYYDRKSFRAPTPWQLSLARAWSLGLRHYEISSLFRLLSVANPLPVHP